MRSRRGIATTYATVRISEIDHRRLEEHRCASLATTETPDADPTEDECEQEQDPAPVGDDEDLHRWTSPRAPEPQGASQASAGSQYVRFSAATYEAHHAASVEIEVADRWDALALSELLVPYHSFLVQLDHERWVIHARTPGRHGESLNDALATVEGWAATREREDWACRIRNRPN